MNSAFLKFVIVGASSAVLTLALRGVLSWVVPFEAAVAISHVAGLTIAFSLNRLFVFAHFSGSLAAAYCHFFLANLLSLALATGVGSVAYRFLLPDLLAEPYRGYCAHFIGLAAATIPSYILHSRFSFRSRTLPRTRRHSEL